MYKHPWPIIWAIWAALTVFADFAKAPPNSNARFSNQQQTSSDNQINKVVIEQATNNKAKFSYEGQITTNMDVADIVITFDENDIKNTSDTIAHQILNLRPLINDDKFIDAALKSLSTSDYEMISHDQLIKDLSKRGLWGPMALVTSLIGTGLSAAALAASAANKNNILNLEKSTNRIFKVHQATINDHAAKITQITTTNTRLMKELNIIRSDDIKTKIKDVVKSFKKSVRTRSRLLENILTGSIPLSILDQPLINSISDLMKDVRAAGKTSFEDLKPIELVQLPITVGNMGDGIFNIHFHVPVFEERTSDIMDVYTIRHLPWILNDNDFKIIAIPSPHDNHDTIVVQNTDTATELHQIKRLTEIQKCPKFRNIRLCAPTGVFNTEFSSSCLGALFSLDTHAIIQNCNLIQPKHENLVFQISSTDFLTIISDQIKLSFKNADEQNTRTQRLKPGLYNMHVPIYGWVKTKYSLIRPTYPHQISHRDINAFVDTASHDIDLKHIQLQPFTKDDIAKMKSIKAAETNDASTLKDHHNDPMTITALILSSLCTMIIAIFVIHVAHSKRNANTTNNDE